MNRPEPISPDDVRQFIEGTLTEDRQELLLQALEDEDPKVLRWMEILDFEDSDLSDSESDAAANDSLRALIGSRMKSLSRAALWAFSANPLPALLAGEPRVRVELFGKLAGRDQTFDVVLERVAGSDREFSVRIPDLPASFEPLNLTLADFELWARNESTSVPEFQTCWAPVTPEQESDAASSSRAGRVRSLAASSQLALDGTKMPRNHRVNFGGITVKFESPQRLRVQTDRGHERRLDVVLLDIRDEQDRSTNTKQALLLDQVVGNAPCQVLRTYFDLPSNIPDAPIKHVDLRARALRMDELCELSPAHVDTLLGHTRFSPPPLIRREDHFRLCLSESDIASIQRHPGDHCALRVALPEAEVRS